MTVFSKTQFDGYPKKPVDDVVKATSDNKSCAPWNAPTGNLFGDLTQITPAKGLLRMFEDLESAFAPPAFRLSSFNPIVPLDVKETEQNFEIAIDAPGKPHTCSLYSHRSLHSCVMLTMLSGVSKDDIQVEVHNHILTISYDRNITNVESTDRYHRIERSWGQIRRSVALPPDVREVRATGCDSARHYFIAAKVKTVNDLHTNFYYWISTNASQDDIFATYTNGVLHITVPKISSCPPATGKRIEVAGH